MRWPRLALVACAVLAGCASEGGVSGTGISASLSGNVTVVTEAAQSADLPFPIRVSIEAEPAVSATTDDEGAFTLSGAFSGAIEVRFANAADGSPLGELALDVPAGSSTVLENIEIHVGLPAPDQVQPAAVRQLDFFGRIDVVECGAQGEGVLLVSDDARPPRQFMIVLAVDTEIIARDGNGLTCAELSVGMTAKVEGLLRLTDQATVALLVVAAPERPMPPPADEPRPERLRGRAVATDCSGGLVEVEQQLHDETVRRIVRLSAQTEIRCAGEPPIDCGCADITPDTPLAVSGTIVPARPGVVLAELVVVGQVPRRLELTGRIRRINCAANGFTIAEERLDDVLRVRVSDHTAFRCGRLPCACEDLQPGDRVRVEGIAGRADRRMVEAQLVTRLLPPMLDLGGP